MFFFEKKNQKTFTFWRTRWGWRACKLAKVFWFFSSEKNTFLFGLVSAMRNPNCRGLFFFHNPKAGGTSVNRALAAMFPVDARCPLIENTEREHEQRAGEYAAFRGYGYYGGHYGRDIFAQVAENHDATTNFRHPAARLHSLYDYYRLAVTVPPDAASRDALYPVIMAQTHDFRDFVAMDDPRVEIHTRNHHVRQLSMSAWDPASQGDLAAATELLDSMVWFYVCEQPEASQRWADAVFGGQCGPIGWENMTAGPQRSAGAIDTGTMRVIADRNALDFALYEHAVGSLAQRVGSVKKGRCSSLKKRTKRLLRLGLRLRAGASN
jgi:hypothetical protein